MLSPGGGRLIVGLSGPAMLADKKHAEHMEPWRVRADRVLSFVAGIVDPAPFDERKPPRVSEADGTLLAAFDADEGRQSLLVEIHELSDPFGPTITDEGVTSLVVTKETEAGGASVNRRRVEKGWPPLEVGVVDLLMDGGQKLSSTELRRKAGEKTAVGTA